MNDDIRLIRDFAEHCDPADDVPVDEVRRAAVLRSILEEDTPRRFRRRYLLAPVAAVAAAALTVTLWGGGPGEHAYAATPRLLAYQGTAEDAGEVLRAMADDLQRTPGRDTAGKYDYLETQGWYLYSRDGKGLVRSTVVPSRTRTWLAADGSGRTEKQVGSGGEPSSNALPPGGHVFMWAPGSLSDDPGELRRQLEIGHPASGDAERLVAVGDLYRERHVSKDLRVAVLRVLAGLRDLRYEGWTTDRLGRRGVGFSLDTEHGGLPNRRTLIFSKETGGLLGEEETLTKTAGRLNVPIPSVISYTAFAASGRVDRVGATP